MLPSPAWKISDILKWSEPIMGVMIHDMTNCIKELIVSIFNGQLIPHALRSPRLSDIDKARYYLTVWLKLSPIEESFTSICSHWVILATTNRSLERFVKMDFIFHSPSFNVFQNGRLDFGFCASSRRKFAIKIEPRRLKKNEGEEGTILHIVDYIFFE